MNTRHSLIVLASVSLLAACAVGSTEAEIDDGGDAGSGAGATATTGAGGTTGAGNGPVTGAGTGGTTTGAGGAPTTTGAGAGATSGSGTTSSAGGATTGSVGSTTATSSSSGGGTCAHDVCTEGVALTFGCDACVDTVCNNDPFCCDMQGGTWDGLCIDGAVQLCGACTMVGAVQPGDLIITEIMNNPSAVTDANGEWFEIFNDAPYAIDLQGLDINHTANNPAAVHTIAQSVVVASGGYVVLGNNSNSSTNGGVVVDYQYSGVTLNNTTDYLAIVDGTTVIDQVTWDEASGLDPNGASRSLDPLYTSALQNDTDMNFCTASSMMSGGDAGTPGSVNDPCP
ncbi:MAG TPA: lamin tail domain-containing protein [Polyangiaceae bacterium]|nr:lamin tail domain-containing protein [Polyangiaceae bacterium]